MRHNRRGKILAAVLAMCLLLSGCGKSDKQAQELLGGIEPRDSAKYVNIAMTVQLVPDASTSYDVHAEWEDANGVRHLISCISSIEHDGVDEAMAAEAWADKNAGKTYIYTGSTGWLERDYSDKADAVPALDLDAAIGYIGRMGRTDDAKKATSEELSIGGHKVSWDTKFSDVRKLAGNYGSDFKAETAHVTAEFDTGGTLTNVSIISENKDGGRFDVKITLNDWNADKSGFAVPENIIASMDQSDPDFVIDVEQQDPMDDYHNEYNVPEDFEDEIMAAFAKNIIDSGEMFDKIEASAIPGGSELQYHSHGKIGTGYWFGVIAIDGYGPGGAGKRLEELTAYNDAWYGGRIVNPMAPLETWDGFASWGAMHPEDQAYKIEMCFLYGDVCVDIQIEAYLTNDVGASDLLEHAQYMLRTAGLLE